jgi:hypothetical protein
MGSTLSALTSTRESEHASNTNIGSGTLDHPEFMEEIAKVLNQEPGMS